MEKMFVVFTERKCLLVQWPCAENQSSIKTTEAPVNPLHPEASPSNTSTLPSISVTTPGNSSQFQGTEDAKNASSSSASPSYSSIILPVVIALIVVTLSAFVLVGLYRMCWKTDPGTPENGNDQTGDLCDMDL
ncbi:hypothetical protein GH733_016423, partial [Mirounga leonina]